MCSLRWSYRYVYDHYRRLIPVVVIVFPSQREGMNVVRACETVANEALVAGIFQEGMAIKAEFVHRKQLQKKIGGNFEKEIKKDFEVCFSSWDVVGMVLDVVAVISRTGHAVDEEDAAVVDKLLDVVGAGIRGSDSEDSVTVKEDVMIRVVPELI
ncbi:hypothetical protein TNCV_3045201 [Trichonephila clavipes]|nr:hypothetical protein TNCV_3045201 [Trichonephila clavipes]